MRERTGMDGVGLVTLDSWPEKVSQRTQNLGEHLKVEKEQSMGGQKKGHCRQRIENSFSFSFSSSPFSCSFSSSLERRSLLI